MSESTMQKERDAVLVRLAWGAFLIGAGLLWLAENLVMFVDLSGSVAVWAGLVLLGLNAVRNSVRLPVSRFTVGLGAVLILVGVADLASLDLPLVPLVLMIIGLVLLADVIRGRNTG